MLIKSTADYGDDLRQHNAGRRAALEAAWQTEVAGTAWRTMAGRDRRSDADGTLILQLRPTHEQEGLAVRAMDNQRKKPLEPTPI
ncbi:hypothetical protein PF001_g399 [Phytophthora fragariae]|uniref:Uncharacterized protein n=2 Tax=Phytophthora fragariae TaxID=53985 RepID=A0A6A4F1B2_9STRA|nr:hypothetical protein PF001_g399 [Phytophthora fragariae]